MTQSMTPAEIESLFTRADGTFLCARWGRPIVPVVFGVDEATLQVVKGAIEVTVALAGHKIAETDPELGANLMVFFFRDWAELPQVPKLEEMIPGLAPLCERLAEAGANQYRTFRYDKDGTIRAAFVFLRMDEHLVQMPAEDLALLQAVKVMLSWGEGAFADLSPLVMAEGQAVLRPEFASLIRAAYDPVLPAVNQDRTHALRLYARILANG